MTTHYVTRQDTKNLLKGNQAQAILIQAILLVSECTVFGVQAVLLYKLSNPVAALLLGGTLDLLLLSPLKAGRARYYQNLIPPQQSAQLSDLVFFFQYRYERTIFWRIRVWVTRILWSAVFCLPSAVVFTVCRLAEIRGLSTVATIAFILAIILFVFALILTEIRMFRYISVVFCLSECSVRKAFQEGVKCSKKFYGQWTLFHLEYAASALVFWLAIPYFFATPIFHAARAATSLKLLRKNSTDIGEQHLKRRRNHGKIVGEF